jgi:DNA-directed RNA polymerase subunit L
MSTAEVVRVEITRKELTAAEVPALRELFDLERLPLAQAHVKIEIKGVSTAVVNALRRAATDEMLGYALEVPVDGFSVQDTTELMMLPQFVNQRIALLPLRAQAAAGVADKLRLQLDRTNRDASTLAVYAGDLEIVEGEMPEPLFNPTFKLAVLQPGKRLVIRGIRVAAGYGRDNGAFLVARRAAYGHRDIPQHTEAETHEADGAAADSSGYKESSLVANPRHHVLTATLAATSPNLAETRAVFADACANVKDRLLLLRSTVERQTGAPGGFAHRGVQYTVVQLETGLSEGVLQVPGETYTIGELLRRAVYELAPDVPFVAYVVSSHENRMNFTVRHTEDVTRLLLGAIRDSIAIFDALQRGIVSAPGR